MRRASHRSLVLLALAAALLLPATGAALPRPISGRLAIPRGLASTTDPFTVACPAERSVRPTEQVELEYVFSGIPPGATTLFWEWERQRDWPVLDGWQVGPYPDGSLAIVYLVAVPETVSVGLDSMSVTAWTDVDPGLRTGCAHVVTIPPPRFAPFVVCSPPAAASPGAALQLDFAVTNALPSTQLVFWSVTNDRGWTLPIPGGSLPLGGDSTAVLPVSFTVPDTIAPGTNRMRFRAQLAGSHPDADSCVTDLRWGTTGVEAGAGGAPFALRGVRPNPSRGGPTIAFSLAGTGRARLEVLDTAGRRVRERDLGALPAGPCRVSLEGEPLPAGVYLVRLTQGGRSLSARAVVVR